MQTSERRTATRHKLGTFLTAIVDDTPALCLSGDVSQSGMHIRTSTTANLENTQVPVLVRFSLPGEHESLWACGRVVRHEGRERDQDAAISFTYLPERTRRKLAALDQAA